MSKIYYDKTAKGKEEISTRSYHLSAKLRPLLVIIDGKHTEEEILRSVQGLGLGKEHIEQLLKDAFIAPRVLVADAEATKISTTIATNPVVPQAAIEVNPQARLLALRSFFNETVKSTLGLRGFGLQLKVERAGTLEDFVQLREAYLDAVEKAKGHEMARSLGARLDEILYKDHFE
ncbi:hypothetical protein [Undibacterium fentianense]|uniref:Uncharacterized protein n=1 Tax=Undibacterium fentianense TaxID=2828728 RepID=A0A941E730_9BURK|nr:hypothetical protein [Undibacterium fentianense]MBR7801794.1 hypothetical protein [Undibacterium fentianense]